MNLIASWWKDLSALFYPSLCPGCFDPLPHPNDLICGFCCQQLPLTAFAGLANNPIEKIFVGRLPVVAAHSECYFSKGQIVQRIMHELKYKNNQKIGVWLGKIMGMSLLNSKRFADVDYIIPIPMEKSKEKKRGYNQAEILAHGIAAVLNKPVLNNIVIKPIKTDSQTKKDRTERWINIRDSFVLDKKELLNNKNILLVDDVITTGATIEACGQQLLSAHPAGLFIVSAAIAEK